LREALLSADTARIWGEWSKQGGGREISLERKGRERADETGENRETRRAKVPKKYG
jgi:hypothetical protein